MRYALLMCGQPRTMEFCFPSLKSHILDIYNPDVFVCSDESQDRLIELFNPVAIDIRSQEYIDSQISSMRERYQIPGSEQPVHKDLSISWKVWRANQMKYEHERAGGFKYDVVFISRFDVKFSKIQPVGKVEDNKIYVPVIGAYHITPPDAPGIHWKGYSAHLCWMPSRVADMVAGMYFEGEDNFSIANAVDPTWGKYPEHVFKNFCERNEIKAVFVKVSMMLIRGTSESPLSFHHHSLEEFPEYQ